MAILTPSQLVSASNATYFDNTSGSITPGSVRTLNTDWISSSILVSQTGSMSVASASVATSANSSVSSSYAATASVLLGGVVSASHADQADTASYALTASLLLGTIATASYALNAELLDGLDSTSFTTTSSFNSFTSSVETNYATKAQVTASVNTLSASIAPQITNLTNASASFAVASGSTSTRLTNLESWSASLDNGYVTNAELNASSSALQAGVTSSINVAVSNLQAGVTASIAGFANTASNTFTGTNIFNVVTASFVKALSASIDYLSVVYQTSSVIFSSGSNVFGDNANDTQTLYGTVNVITGPLLVTGSANFKETITGSISTALNANNAISASYALNGGVTQLLAGPNITLSPISGKGQVTISATGGGGPFFNTATGSYGSFYDTTIQTNPVANAANSMSFNETDITNGVSISGSTSPFNTYIKTENAGIYNIQFSAQVDKTDSGTDEIDIWLRKNGIDLTDTATKLTLTNNNTKVVAAWNWFVQSAANDYYQIIWASADSDMRLFAEPAGGIHPGIPSVILTANRVDQFLSNTGSFSGSFSGELTGSLFGTASWAQNAVTASYVNTLNQDVVISGSLAVSQSILVDQVNMVRAGFSSNPFNHQPSSYLGSIRFGADNQNFTITNYNQGTTAEAFTSQSIVGLSLNTGSNFVRTYLNADMSNTSGYLNLDNNNGNIRLTTNAAFTVSASNSLFQAPGGTGVGTWFQNRVLISGPAAGETPTLFISSSDGAYTQIGRSSNNINTTIATGIDAAGQIYANDTRTAGQYIGVYTPDTFLDDVEHAIIVSNAGVTLNDWDNGSAFDYVPYLTIAPNLGDNPAPVFTRGLGVSGSVNGNVQAITVSSNTASIDLATGNFFTVTLANSATTFFNVTNVTPGSTANLVLTTGTVSSASFSSNVKQSSGNSYLPTSGSGQIDALSLLAVDATNVYLVASKKFI